MLVGCSSSEQLNPSNQAEYGLPGAVSVYIQSIRLWPCISMFFCKSDLWQDISDAILPFFLQKSPLLGYLHDAAMQQLSTTVFKLSLEHLNIYSPKKC